MTTHHTVTPEEVTPDVIGETERKAWATIKEIRRHYRNYNRMGDMPRPHPVCDYLDYIIGQLERVGVSGSYMVEQLEYALKSPTGKTGVDTVDNIKRTFAITINDTNRLIEEAEVKLLELAKVVAENKKARKGNL